jgi:hypothetical protein
MIVIGDTMQPSSGSVLSLPAGTSLGVGGVPQVTFDSQGFLNLRPGTVIESLWSLCDGSSHVLSTGTYTVGNVTAQQGITNSYADITGSTITYTPPSGATKVVYRFTYSSYWANGSHSILHNKFLIDGIDVTHSRHNRSATYNEQRYTFEWVIGIGGNSDTSTGRQNVWSGPKTLKMQARNYASGSNDANLHGTYYWEGTGGNVFSMPIINIIAIR